MRLIAVLILAAVMYFGVPYLWQRAMVAEVNRIAADKSNFPDMNAMVTGIPDSTFENGAALANALNPPLNFNVEEAEAFGAQAAADRQMRDIQAAQAAADRARYP